MMHEGMPGMGPHPPGYEPEAGWMAGVIGEQPWERQELRRLRADNLALIHECARLRKKLRKRKKKRTKGGR